MEKAGTENLPCFPFKIFSGCILLSLVLINSRSLHAKLLQKALKKKLLYQNNVKY